MIKKLIDSFNGLVPAIRNVVIIAVIILVVILFKDFTNKKNIIDGFINESKQHEQNAKIALIVNDSLKQEVIKHQKIAEDVQQKIAILESRVKTTQATVATGKHKIDSLKNALKDTTHSIRDSIDILTAIVPKQDTIIMKQDIVIALRETQIQLQEKIVLQKDSSIKKLLIANDTLSKIIASTPTLKKNTNKLFGFIPLPSRRTAAVVGFIGGVITTAGIAR